ncbi:MAG: ferrous iron transport protein A [Opitutales bacterium]|nr:ferrous iron transport protein A [Opitutales bacterium]
MTLALSPLNKPVEILQNPINSDAKRRLETLGIIVGRRVLPVGESAGSLILKVGDSKIALNKSTAMQIKVKL